MTKGRVSSCLGLALALMALVSSPALGQELTVDQETLTEVDRYLRAQRTEQGWPGLAVGIVAGGHSVMLEGYGVSEEGGPEIGPDSVFLIASLSKSITALAVMQLVDRGLVDLNAPIADYMDELQPGGNDVTVADVMYQRSGLDRYTGNEPFVEPFGDSLAANVERLGPLLRDDAPFQYSNANYDTLARLVEEISGKDFSDYVGEQIFSPLGMDDSFVGPPVDADVVQGHYHRLFLGFGPHTPPMPPGLSGSHLMFSSVEDLTKLILLHLEGNADVVSAEGLSTLHGSRAYGNDTNSHYAGGLRVDQPGMPGLPDSLAPYTTLWHTGDSDSYKANMWVMPEAGLGAVLLTNAHDATNPAPLDLVAQNVKLTLAGEDRFAFENQTEFLLRWSKHLMFLLVAVQGSLAVLTIRSMRRNTLRWWLITPATVLDVVALVALLYLIPTVGEAPLRVVFNSPDYRWLITGISVGIIWGVARTAFVIARMMRRRPSPAN